MEIRGQNSRPIVACFPAMPILGVAGALIVLLLLPACSMFERPSEFTIEVDPWAERILVDNTFVGSRNRVVLEEPPTGNATISVHHKNFKPWKQDVKIVPGETIRVKLQLNTPMSFIPTADHKRAKIDQDIANAVMTEFKPGFDSCLRSDGKGHNLRGIVRIHVGRDGHTTGMEIQGDGAHSPEIVACLRRQAAVPVFPPFRDGDFATIRYTYGIPAPQ